ncbi:hypothetical protein IIA15_11310, partial [candidate division TA06 bacterium]|nr:hypothetical protein [candidate division TA06 bacterium]
AALELARADGFESVADLVDFIRETHGLPFEGTLIGWSEISPECDS